MPWLQISVQTTQEYAEQTEETLLQNGAYSVTFKDAADNPILEPGPGETPIWQDIIATGLFEYTDKPAPLLSTIETGLAGAIHSISSETLDDQNWSRSWMNHYEAMKFGERLWI